MKREILYRFFEGKASYEEEEEVCQWAEASELNLQEYIKERKYFDLLLIQNKRSSASHKKIYRLHNWVQYAAVVALLLICGLQIYQIRGTDIGQEMNIISVPAGQRVNLILSDGTNVWLNAGSKMKYPASFAKQKGKRKIILDGEGYFEVAKNKKKPFVVQTNRYDIEVLGTKFNVDAYTNTSAFSAALIEGAIQISDRVDSSNNILLRPLQKADYINGHLVVEKIQNYNVYRWKEGLLCFEHIAFNDLMKEFEKTYDIQIINENKNLDNYRCSGKFRISDGVDFILHVLQRDVRFSFHRNENNTILYIQ